MLPNFMIIGTMKGGTTSLYRYIASHPMINGSSIKETEFFTSDGNFNKGVSWYKSMFQGKGKYAFEASPNYTKRHIFPSVPERIHSILPDVKLIYVLRDPIERIISHYMHNHARGAEPRSLSEALWNDCNYIQTSRYYFQIQAFLEYYSDKQLLIVESEKLRSDTSSVLSDVFNFLEIPADYDARIIEKHFHLSQKKRHTTAAELALKKKTNNPFLISFFQMITKLTRKPIERPNLSLNDKEMIAAELSPDVEKLRQFSNLKFSKWSI